MVLSLRRGSSAGTVDMPSSAPRNSPSSMSWSPARSESPLHWISRCVRGAISFFPIFTRDLHELIAATLPLFLCTLKGNRGGQLALFGQGQRVFAREPQHELLSRQGAKLAEVSQHLVCLRRFTRRVIWRLCLPYGISWRAWRLGVSNCRILNQRYRGAGLDRRFGHWRSRL